MLQKNSDNKRYLQNIQKQAIFEVLRLHYLKFQIPTAYGLEKLRKYFSRPPTPSLLPVQEQCVICWEAVGSEDSQDDVPLELACGHASWCSSCLLRSLRENSECPLCRSSVPEDLWQDRVPRRSRRRRFPNGTFG